MSLSEKDSCIKCDKGGKLLSCSDSSCPIVVHEKCMGVKAEFDDVGNFYCPYCLYRRVTEELCRAREKALSRKKALSSFIDLDMVNGESLAYGSRRLEEKEIRRSSETVKENDIHRYDYSAVHIDEASVHKNLVQKDMEKVSPECATSASPSNRMPGANAGQGNCNKQRKLVGQLTLCEPVVACGNDGTCSEEEGTTQQFEMVEIRVDQHKNQLADNHSNSDEDPPSGEHHLGKSTEAGKERVGDEFSSSTENAESVAKPSEKNEDETSGEVEMEDECDSVNHHIGDSPGAVPQEAGHDLFSPAKDVTYDAKSSDGNVEVHSGKEETEEQAEESISSFDSDAALPQQCRGRRNAGAVEVITPDSDPNSDARHVRINTRRRDLIDGLRSSTRNRSSRLRSVAAETEDNSPLSEIKKRKQPSAAVQRNLLPNLRRKKLPWNEDEVEMLQEGVQKFSTTVNKNIPWRKILEFGRHVFHGTRNPQDLKDKWRNTLPKEK